MSLVLATDTNPGTASWVSAAGSASAWATFGFVTAGGTITPQENSACYCTTDVGAIAITVANPAFVGQMLSFYFRIDGGGDVVITFPATLNSAGNTIVTMQDASDSFIAIAITTDGGVARWVPLQNNGCTLT